MHAFSELSRYFLYEPGDLLLGLVPYNASAVSLDSRSAPSPVLVSVAGDRPRRGQPMPWSAIAAVLTSLFSQRADGINASIVDSACWT